MSDPLDNPPDDPRLSIRPEGWTVTLDGPSWQEREAHVLDTLGMVCLAAFASGITFAVLLFPDVGVPIGIVGGAGFWLTRAIKSRSWDRVQHTLTLTQHQLRVDGPMAKRIPTATIVDARADRDSLLVHTHQDYDRRYRIATHNSPRTTVAWLARQLRAVGATPQDVDQERRAEERLRHEAGQLGARARSPQDSGKAKPRT